MPEYELKEMRTFDVPKITSSLRAPLPFCFGFFSWVSDGNKEIIRKFGGHIGEQLHSH